MSLRGTLAFTMLPQPAAAPGPYKALVPGEGTFHLEYEKKPFLAPPSPWMPWDSWPQGLGEVTWH